jgi:hypothetical protein
MECCTHLIAAPAGINPAARWVNVANPAPLLTGSAATRIFRLPVPAPLSIGERQSVFPEFLKLACSGH